jgi:hypothetical protein
MTIFNGGPASGKVMNLRRAPLFLRVTETGGKYDALDQLSDAPRPEEKLFAYRRVGEPGAIHIRARGGGGGFFALATYLLVTPQPADEAMRTATAWQAWCVARKDGK